MAHRWFYEKDGRTHGPYELPSLQYLFETKVLGAKTPVREGEQGEWMPADSVAGLVMSRPTTESRKPGSAEFANPASSTASILAGLGILVLIFGVISAARAEGQGIHALLSAWSKGREGIVIGLAMLFGAHLVRLQAELMSRIQDLEALVDDLRKDSKR